MLPLVLLTQLTKYFNIQLLLNDLVNILNIPHGDTVALTFTLLLVVGYIVLAFAGCVIGVIICDKVVPTWETFRAKFA